MIDPVQRDINFNLLSVKDLLEARDHYHVHLMHKTNVVATAIGRYLIQDKGDPKAPRTLANSRVRENSWPCVLVFVQNWVDRDQFSHTLSPAEMVPPALYMPDGRVVPVCVVLAERDEGTPEPIGQLHFPNNLIGGGYPIVINVQGQEHVASIGCLLTDGHLVYALTNRHVAGEAGEKLYTILHGERVEIGVSSKKQLRRKCSVETLGSSEDHDVQGDRSQEDFAALAPIGSGAGAEPSSRFNMLLTVSTCHR